MEVKLENTRMEQEVGIKFITSYLRQSYSSIELQEDCTMCAESIVTSGIAYMAMLTLLNFMVRIIKS